MVLLATAKSTMRLSPHLFPSAAEELADRLDATHRKVLASARKAIGSSEVSQLGVAEKKQVLHL
jgi:hypothetical protein